MEQFVEAVADRRPDADQPWTRCSPPRAPRSRWPRAWPAASRSWCERSEGRGGAWTERSYRGTRERSEAVLAQGVPPWKPLHRLPGWPGASGGHCVNSAKLGWYARRLARMSPAEVAWRVREQALRRAWARRQVRPEQVPGLPPLTTALPIQERRFTSVLPPGAGALVPAAAQEAIIADADRLLDGEWEMLGVVRTDMKDPDWFHDPATGRRSSPQAYAFRVDHRSEGGGRQHQAGLGGQPAAAPDAAGGRLVPDRRGRLRGAGRRAAPLLVGREPVAVRGELDQRHRARRPADQLRLDPAAARRLGRRRRTCSSATTSRCGRSAGTSSTWRRSRAAGRRPTTT